MKQYTVGLLNALMLSLAWSSAVAQPITYFFSGQITGERAQNSIFSGGIGDQFSGYFSYDPTAVAIQPGYYPLLQFSIDGKSLDFSNGTEIPFLPGIYVQPGGFSGLPSQIDIRGFYLPAAADGLNDNGSTSIVFSDFTGSVFTSSGLPTTLNLDSSDEPFIVGEIFGHHPYQPKIKVL